MSIPRKMQEFAAVYGCTIIEKYSGEGDAFYARANDNEEFICRWYDARHVDLNHLKGVLQRVSGRSLAQFWTSGSEATS